MRKMEFDRENVPYQPAHVSCNVERQVERFWMLGKELLPTPAFLLGVVQQFRELYAVLHALLPRLAQRTFQLLRFVLHAAGKLFLMRVELLCYRSKIGR